MPKLKIGTKVSAGENLKIEQKVFKNGHKCFDSIETKTYNEAFERERRIAVNFEKNKHNLLKPRNPLNGEMTPRPGNEYDLLISPELLSKLAEEKKLVLADARNFKRVDKVEERIDCLKMRQQAMAEEIEFLKSEAQNKAKLLQSGKLCTTSRF
jgi:hypothetical protein